MTRRRSQHFSQAILNYRLFNEIQIHIHIIPGPWYLVLIMGETSSHSILLAGVSKT